MSAYRSARSSSRYHAHGYSTDTTTYCSLRDRINKSTQTSKPTYYPLCYKSVFSVWGFWLMPTYLSHFPCCRRYLSEHKQHLYTLDVPTRLNLYDLVDNEITIPSSTARKYIGCSHLLICTCSLWTAVLTYSIIQPNYVFALGQFDFLAISISRLKISVLGCHQNQWILVHFPPSTNLSILSHSKRRASSYPPNIQITIWIKTAAHLPTVLDPSAAQPKYSASLFIIHGLLDFGHLP